MKLLTDENIGLEIVEFLRTHEHDVSSIIELSPGAGDIQILVLAYKEKRVLVTSDTDFGELVYLHKLKHTGIILLRLSDETNSNKIRVLKELFSMYSAQLLNNFVVVTETKIRIRQPQLTN